MGFWGSLVVMYKKSEAAVVLQKLFEGYKRQGLLESGPAALANKLIESAWVHESYFFEGRFGGRPHKLSAAAIALVHSNYVLDRAHPDYQMLVLCLGQVIAKAQIHKRLHKFNSVDDALLGFASKYYVDEVEKKAYLLQPRRPDIDYAVKGFANLYSVSEASGGAELHSVEMRFAEKVLNDGGTEEQALSARFGGVLAISADPLLMECLYRRFEEAMEGMPEEYMLSDEYKLVRLNAAATEYISGLLVECPDEYENFLNYIGK
ncbi:hypothetical protein [Pseudomonas schmalbachii]|uniref:Uncharacterized protein n=1 Tax=Pseudomonas schmalbachii TaxID=2816993 RepID=A0ABS3TXY8_9PSED|nr:hypothetical protein [Pseudomonas schmalbachii]MBO3278243.1 hypothetical protein [Pseudomonas schmalbachii]